MKRKIILFSLIVFTFGCSYENKEELFPAAAECETEDISFSAFIKPLSERSCAKAGCHVGSFPSANLDLSDYEGLKQIADDGQFVGRITETSGSLMPQDGALPQCEILKITSWVQAGAPNN